MKALFDRNGKELCRGFITVRYAGIDILETRYAKLNNGTILRSNESKTKDAFSYSGESWEVIEELPWNAEFIGNYHVPK